MHLLILFCMVTLNPTNAFRVSVCMQAQPDPNQWNAGYYGYAQGYENYGYAAAAPQDPSMYYGGYPGYGNYQQPQQPQQ